MCQKLIQMSFAKIVNSKHERGGAKLHKNLLILRVLQKARTEHRRSSDSPTEMDFTSFSSEQDCQENHQEEAEDQSVDDDQLGSETDRRGFPENNDCFSDSVTEPNSLRPPLLRFVSVDESEESVIVEESSENYESESDVGHPFLGDLPDLVPLVESEFVIPQPHEVEVGSTQETTYSYSDTCEVQPLTQLNPPPSGVSEPAAEQIVAPGPVSKFAITSISSKKAKKSNSTDSGCSSGSSSPSSSEEDEETEESGDSDDSLTSSDSRQSTPDGRRAVSPSGRRRKRKHRSPSVSENGERNKKSCVEVDNAQLSGLISDFRNAGFTTPADSRDSEKDPFVYAPSSDSGSCASSAVPPRSISCPSFLQLTTCQS